MKRILTGLAVLALAAPAAHAQFIGEREDNVVTISTNLTGCTDDYVFSGSAGQLVFADIDASLFGGGAEFCLEIVGPTGLIEASADNGFFLDFDPALGYQIPTTATRRVRVSLNDGSCGDGGYDPCGSNPGDPAHFYHLNISIRNRAPETTVPLAVAASKNILAGLQ